MKRDAGLFRAVTVPVPRPDPPADVRFTALLGADTISGTSENQSIQIEGHKYRFSELHRVRGKPDSSVQLSDGRTIRGAVSGFESVKVKLGTQALTLNLSEATEVRFELRTPPTSVMCHVVSFHDGKEVSRVTETIQVRGAVVKVVENAGTDIKSPVMADGKSVHVLPSAIADVAIGGGGRYLILYMPKVRKLAIFDVNAATIVHEIALADDNVKFAAGMDKLLVVTPSNSVIQRWSLKTFERELTNTLAVRGLVRNLVMGSASQGPLLVGADTTLAIDIETLKTLPVKMNGVNFGDGIYARAASNGKVFGAWMPQISPQGLQCIIFDGAEMLPRGAGESVGHVIPGPDGRVIYTARGRYSLDPKPLDKVPISEGLYCLPAVHGHYYLTFELGQKIRLAVHVAGDARPLVHLNHVEVMDGINQWDREEFGADKRIHFMPDAKLIVTIPKSNDRLLLYRFDVEEVLEKSGLDYLFVTSQPPLMVKRGTELVYPLQVKSKKAGLKFRLETGPMGMTVTEAGELRWQIPVETIETEIPVIVSVQDAAGQECIHAFKVTVRD